MSAAETLSTRNYFEALDGDFGSHPLAEIVSSSPRAFATLFELVERFDINQLEISTGGSERLTLLSDKHVLKITENLVQHLECDWILQPLVSRVADGLTMQVFERGDTEGIRTSDVLELRVKYCPLCPVESYSLRQTQTAIVRNKNLGLAH